MLLAHNNELYVPSRQLFGFENSLAGASAEDVLNLASALADVNSEPGKTTSDFVDVLRSAEHQSEPDAVRNAVRQGIEILIHLDIKPTKQYPRDHRSLEVQEELASIKTSNAFLGMNTDKWQQLATRLGQDAVELRQTMMGRVFKFYRQHD